MLKARIIPTLLHGNAGLVKGVAFDSRRAVGAALQAVRVYEMRGVDELVLLDVVATLDDRSPDLELVDDLADECFMPLTVGGGIRDADDVGALLQVGADKVVLGTVALERPEVVDEAARRYGSQCVVVAIDCRRDAGGRPSAWTRSATRDAGRDPVELAREVQERGAGELLVQSVDRDGTMDGYDLDLIEQVAASVEVPVVASGGAGGPDDFLAALRIPHVTGAAAASVFHYTELTPAEVKAHLHAHGIPVRHSVP